MSESKSELARLRERELEKEHEAVLRTSARTKRRLERIKKIGAARRSGKSPPRRYRDVDADEKLFKAIKASVKAGDEIFLVSRPGPAVEDFRKQKTRRHIKRATAPTGHGPTSSSISPASSSTASSPGVTRRFWCPSWDHATDRIKALAWSKVIYVGDAYTMDVNLGDGVITSIKAKGSGFAKHVLDRITKHLRRRMEPVGLPVPPLFLWIETSHRSPPHVHGVIIFPPNRPDALDVAKTALKAASGNDKANAVHLKPIYEAIGWLAYITKWQTSTRIRLGDDNIAAATWGVKRAAKAWYLEARRGTAPLA